MTITVLKLSDADAYLKNISIKTIKDVRALDVDLMLILMNGDRIIINTPGGGGWGPVGKESLSKQSVKKDPKLAWRGGSIAGRQAEAEASA